MVFQQFGPQFLISVPSVRCCRILLGESVRYATVLERVAVISTVSGQE